MILGVVGAGVVGAGVGGGVNGGVGVNGVVTGGSLRFFGIVWGLSSATLFFLDLSAVDADAFDEI